MTVLHMDIICDSYWARAEVSAAAVMVKGEEMKEII